MSRESASATQQYYGTVGKVKHRILTAITMPFIVYAADAGGIVKSGELPNTFDFPNHMTNFAASYMLGAIAGNAAGHIRSLEEGAVTDVGQSKRRLRYIMGAAGLAVGTVANLMAETKLGVSLTHLSKTPDTMDLAYGVVGAATGALHANSIHYSPDTNLNPDSANTNPGQG